MLAFLRGETPAWQLPLAKKRNHDCHPERSEGSTDDLLNFTNKLKLITKSIDNFHLDMLLLPCG